MIHEVRVTNPRDAEPLILPLANPEQSGFIIRKIDGLGPPKSNVNLRSNAYISGSSFTSVRTPSRNIVFELEFLPTTGAGGHTGVDVTRQMCYRYFPYESMVNLEIVTDFGSYFTSGIVESNEPTIFSQNQGAVVSIICPDPALMKPSPRVNIPIDVTSALFEFPLSDDTFLFGESIVDAPEFPVPFDGTISTAPTIELTASGDAIHNPTIYFYNEFSSETMEFLAFEFDEINFPDLEDGDSLVIVCEKGNKSVTRHVVADGSELNYLGAVSLLSSWPILAPGGNLFTYEAISGGGALRFAYSFEEKFSGI